MHKYVIFTFNGDKSVSLCGVKPLTSSFDHLKSKLGKICQFTKNLKNKSWDRAKTCLKLPVTILLTGVEQNCYWKYGYWRLNFIKNVQISFINNTINLAIILSNHVDWTYEFIFSIICRHQLWSVRDDATSHHAKFYEAYTKHYHTRFVWNLFLSTRLSLSEIAPIYCLCILGWAWRFFGDTSQLFFLQTKPQLAGYFWIKPDCAWRYYCEYI